MQINAHTVILSLTVLSQKRKRKPLTCATPPQPQNTTSSISFIYQMSPSIIKSQTLSYFQCILNPCSDWTNTCLSCLDNLKVINIKTSSFVHFLLIMQIIEVFLKKQRVKLSPEGFKTYSFLCKFERISGGPYSPNPSVLVGKKIAFFVGFKKISLQPLITELNG